MVKTCDFFYFHILGRMEVAGSRQKSPKFYCETCDYSTRKHNDFLKHTTTRKHRNAVDSSELELIGIEKTRQLSPTHFTCESCNYSSICRATYETHIVSEKHISTVNGKKEPLKHTCVHCNKTYSNSGGLWKHKQKCKEKEKDDNKESKEKRENLEQTELMNMFISFMKQNADLQNSFVEKTNELQNTILEQSREHSKQILEITKNQAMVINNTTNNNNNQQFNIQVFLNETCKDAMNIMDFVNSLQLKIEDFETTGKLGYIEGISQIIINGLKKIDTTKRPIHCTDVKRETLYIKHEDSWEKEEPDKTKLKKAVKQVARMNLSQLPKWQKENPDSTILDTKDHDNYVKYSMAALGGKGEEEEEQFVNKIMKNVMKEVVIDKNK